MIRITTEPYAAGAGPDRELDLYLPERPTHFVLFIHGGAWISGDKSEYVEVGKRFAEADVAFAAANYQLSTDPAVKFPRHALDAAPAYAWLEQRAAGQRLVVMGHSAGAHTAAMLSSGLLQAEGSPAAFIGLEGIYDIGALVRKWPAYEDWFVQKAFGTRESWDQGSPSLLPIALKAPWLVIHSTEDELVDTHQSKSFAQHLVSEGIPTSELQGEFGAHDAAVLDLGRHDNVLFRLILDFIHAL